MRTGGILEDLLERAALQSPIEERKEGIFGSRRQGMSRTTGGRVRDLRPPHIGQVAPLPPLEVGATSVVAKSYKTDGQ